MLNFNLNEIIYKMTERIVSVEIVGGLGNQLFKIASAYGYAKRNNGNLQIVKISDCGIRPVYWDTILENIKPYLVESVPCNLEKYDESLSTMYNEIDPLTNEGKYLCGYFQSSKYFEEYKEDIKSLFINHKLLHFINKYDYLLKEKHRVVIIHSRQTDYISLKEIHGPLTHEYYYEAILRMDKVVKDPIYVLCGDDMSFWSKEKLPLSSAIFLLDESDINTMMLLQQFHYFIMSNSTFIWWCVWLADSKHVIAPSKWFGPKGPYPYDDIYEKSWEKI